MKILVLSSYFLPHRGGVEQYVYQTSRRLVKRGHKVWVVTSRLKGMKKKEVIDGIHILRVPSFEVLADMLPVQMPFVPELVKEIGGVDAIITHTRFYPLTMAGGMYAHLSRTPWLHIEHGSSRVNYRNPFVRLGSRFVDATTGKWVLRHARVAGVSKASCSFAKELGAKSCDVLYNGTDTRFFNGSKVKHKGVRVVFVGRLIKEKGVQDLLDAVKGLKADITIVGKGPFERELKQMGGKFVGEKNHLQIREILSRSDILVNPSYAEGLPTSVLEAGSMGLAVIATDVGGTGEIIDNGKNGFLIEPGDIEVLREKLQILIKDSSLRDKFGSNLQEKVRDFFDWDRTTIKLEKLLKSLSAD